MTPIWTAFALFAIPLVGAFVGFDLAFRVTAYRTRQIVREEIDADRQRELFLRDPTWEPVFAVTKRLLNGGGDAKP